MRTAAASTFKPLSRAEISYLVAHDFPDGSVVNLGIGMPTQVADFLPKDREILLHSENGILGMGRAAIGGAMDLAIGARNVIVMMEHLAKDQTPKLMLQCTYPLTGAGVVDQVYTDLAIIDVTPAGFEVRAIIEGLSFEALQQKTAAPLKASAKLAVICRNAQGHPNYV
jgi:acyl CoA:acetate/3-ketoacid CoA transferase beta subunit